MVAFCCIFIHPFHETRGPCEAARRRQRPVWFGLPTPGGMFDPITFVDEIDNSPKLEGEEGGNLARLLKVAA